MSGRAPAHGAIVLAGGYSTRMGRDKASLPFGEGTMLARVVGALAEVVDEVVVVSRAGQALPPVGVLRRGVVVRYAHDDVEGRGPLSGLCAGLAVLVSPVAYASSCDVPFLSGTFVRGMLDALERDPALAVAIAEAEGRLHPLAAAYRRDAVLPVARELLAADRLRPVFLLERLPHVRVPEAALRTLDATLDALANVNRPEEYEAARERLSRGR